MRLMVLSMEIADGTADPDRRGGGTSPRDRPQRGLLGRAAGGPTGDSDWAPVRGSPYRLGAHAQRNQPRPNSARRCGRGEGTVELATSGGGRLPDVPPRIRTRPSALGASGTAGS